MLRKSGGILALTALLLVACTTQPIMNVAGSPIVTSKPAASMDEIRQAIVRAGSGLGWQMTPDRPGHMLGRLALRTHVAVVDVDYTQTVYSIKYRESTNLGQSGDTIHRNYNGWIQNLDKAIKVQLQNL